MKIENKILILTRAELRSLIEKEVKQFKYALLGIIDNYEVFSKKQHAWVLCNLRYITEHKKQYCKFAYCFLNFKLED